MSRYSTEELFSDWSDDGDASLEEIEGVEVDGNDPDNNNNHQPQVQPQQSQPHQTGDDESQDELEAISEDELTGHDSPERDSSINDNNNDNTANNNRSHESSEIGSVVGGTELIHDSDANNHQLNNGDQDASSVVLPGIDSSEVLEVDWKTLFSSQKPLPPNSERCSARRRVSAASILSRTGFSYAHLPQHMIDELLEFCEQESGVPFKPLHEFPALHGYAKEQASLRNDLFTSDKFLSTALSARKDLQIRSILAHVSLDFSHLTPASCDIESPNDDKSSADSSIDPSSTGKW